MNTIKILKKCVNKESKKKMRINYDAKLNFEDVLLQPKRSTLSSRKDVDMTRNFTFRNSGKQMNFLPIFASNMDGVGTFSMAKVLQEHKMMTVITKTTGIEEWRKAVGNGVRLQSVSVCTGTNIMWDKEAQDWKTMQEVLKSFPDIKMITVDVANAYHQNMVDFIKKVRDEYPNKIIVAGNVVTPEMTEELIINGADVVKIGIGPGSVCTTRTMTGVGVPQFSAILDCADAANGVDGHIMADGGCVHPGDIAKAFGGGAHMVMIGGMLAGHDESEQEVVDGKIEFYGMSSDRAREKHGRRKDGYRGNEGRLISLPYRGSVQNTIEDILGGVRSACTYIGARRLKDMPKCASFVTTNNVINRVYERYTK
jgi:GMP reductase